MIAVKTPSLPVFVSAQAMPGADMPAQCLTPVATFQTDDIIVLN